MSDHGDIEWAAWQISRAAFETWHFGGISLSGLREGNGYTDSGVQARWEDWQAACRVGRATALEEAAQACDGEATYEDIAQRCAARIRAMVKS